MVASVKSDDFDRALRALGDAPGRIREYAKGATEVIAKQVQDQAEENLARRSGGGKYTRTAARILTQPATGDGWETVLQTPWFGMEFGGNVTVVWGHRIGTSRAAKIGLEPMWAPWHMDDRQGYIIGQAWHQQMDQEAASTIVADAGAKAISDELDKAGIKRG